MWSQHLDVNGVLGTVLMIWKIHENTVVFGFGWSYVQCWKNCLGYIGQTINLCVNHLIWALGRSWKTVAITCDMHPNMHHKSSCLREMDVAKPKLLDTTKVSFSKTCLFEPVVESISSV